MLSVGVRVRTPSGSDGIKHSSCLYDPAATATATAPGSDTCPIKVGS